jgi:hypothetical protein
VKHTFPGNSFGDRPVSTIPTVEQVGRAFASAGFRRAALERVPETLTSLAGFLEQAEVFRRSDTIMRDLSDEGFRRGQEQLGRAVQADRMQTRTNWLDLLVLR